MSDEDNIPYLTGSSNSSDESVSAGSDSESDCDVDVPPPPVRPSPPPPVRPSGAKPKVKQKKSDKTCEELRKEGNDRFLEKNFTAAIVKYEEAVYVNPGDKTNAAKCYSNIALCYNKKENFSKSIPYSLKAMEAQPGFERGYTRCAASYLGMNRPFMAIFAILKGLAICRGRCQTAHLELREALHEIKQTHKAKVEIVERHIINADKLDILDMEELEHDFLLGEQLPDGASDQPKEREEMKEPPKKNKDFPELALASSSESENDDYSDVSTEYEYEGKNPSKIKKKKKQGKKKKQNSIASEVLRERLKEDKRREDEKIKETKKRELEDVKKKMADSRERDKRELEEIRKRKDEKLQKDGKKTDTKENIKVQFEKISKDASACLLNMVPKSSMERYSEVLEMINNDSDLLWPTSKDKNISNNEEVVVIKYLYARACGETNNYDCILDGLKKLDEIKENHKAVKFPTVFYGYCNLWKKLNRYDKALEAGREGIEFLDKGFNVTPFNWPGMPSQPIQETRKEFLLEILKTLAIELKNPPKPDAVCRWKNCGQVQSSSHISPSQHIHVSDPDFKGYIKVLCSSNCRIDYHKSCWMALKGENMKLSKSATEKDFFGHSCFTPDCNAIIVKIEINEENGSKTTLQDNKLNEKVGVENRKRKEEARIKRERENEVKQERKLENIRKKNRGKLSTKNAKENGLINYSGLNPSASDFVPVIKEKDVNKERISSGFLEKNGPTRLDNDILLKDLDNNKDHFSNGAGASNLESLFGEAVKQQTSSIITIRDDELEETFASGKLMYESMYTESELKPNLGEEARKIKKQIMGKEKNGPPSSVASPNTVSTGAQTDGSSIDMDEMLKQENANLILEMQEIKDKFYKIQFERKLEMKEINDKFTNIAEVNKNLMMENNSYKDQIGEMKQSVSEAAKITDELKKTNGTLNSAITKNYQLRTELEEAKNRLREEASLTSQLNSQLTLASQEKVMESRTNDLLRAKLLQNEFVKYREILRQKQASNQRIISQFRGSPELADLPRSKLALNALDEFSVRLLLASEDLHSQYDTLVRQSESNKDIMELHVDLDYLEPPNIASFHLQPPPPFSTVPPPLLPLSTVPPPLISRHQFSFTRHPSSSMTNSQGANVCPEEVTASSLVPPAEPKTPHAKLSGNNLVGHRMTKPPSHLFGTTLTEAPPILPQPPFSRPVSASQDNATFSTSQNSLGAISRVVEYGASSVPTTRANTMTPYDKLIAQIQKEHPNLSSVDAQTYVLELRKSNNGKLSGMNVQDIMKKVDNFIKRDRGMSGGGSDDDDNCSICFEDMYATDSRYLNSCGHRFHIHCINLWLESPGGAGSTCPMCRNYIVKEDEFPGLGTPRKF